MKTPARHDVRKSVILAVLVTVIVMLALFDPSCQRRADAPHSGPVRSLAPR